jgi:hypothetical protein
MEENIMIFKHRKINTLLILVSVLTLIFISLTGCPTPKNAQKQVENNLEEECCGCGEFEPIYLVVEEISELSVDEIVAFFDDHAHMLSIETEHDLMALEIFINEHFGDFEFALDYTHDTDLDPSIECYVEIVNNISGECIAFIVIHCLK